DFKSEDCRARIKNRRSGAGGVGCGNDRDCGDHKTNERDRAAGAFKTSEAARASIGNRTAEQVSGRACEQRQTGVKTHLGQIEAAMLVEIPREPIEINVDAIAVTEVHQGQSPERGTAENAAPRNCPSASSAGP